MGVIGGENEGKNSEASEYFPLAFHKAYSNPLPTPLPTLQALHKGEAYTKGSLPCVLI